MKPLLIVLLLAGVLASPTRGEEAAALELEMSWLPPVPVLSAVPGRWSYRTTSLAAHSTNSLPRDVLTAYSGETILFSSRGSYDPDGGPIVQRAWYVEYDWAPNKTTFCRASDNYCLQTFIEAFTMIMPALPAGQDSLRIGMFLYLEDDEGQTREKHFVLEVRREGRRLYYARDMLGSVREVVDGNGRVVEVRDYDPWGLELPGRSRVEGVKTREGFTEYEFDDETGLNYGGARYYDPVIGRFTTIDRFASKEPSLSPYQYAGNSPLTNVDVNGDSIVVVFRRLEGLDKVPVHHAALIWYDESLPNPRGLNIAEAFNSTGNAAKPGRLVRRQETDPDGPTIVGRQRIEVPEGMTEAEFVQGLQASADSYDGKTRYPQFGFNCAGRVPCANSNSFIGNTLRQNGVDIQPAERAPLWNRDALPGDRTELRLPTPVPVKSVVLDWLREGERMIRRGY